ncbi:MAG: hypothetical protein ACK42C_04665, partial [Aquificaceae bacterium]
PLKRGLFARSRRFCRLECVVVKFRALSFNAQKHTPYRRKTVKPYVWSYGHTVVWHNKDYERQGSEKGKTQRIGLTGRKLPLLWI